MLTAYHEAGHAVAGYHLRSLTHEVIERVTIIPSDEYSGCVEFKMTEDFRSYLDLDSFNTREFMAFSPHEQKSFFRTKRRYHQAEVLIYYAGEIAAGRISGKEEISSVQGGGDLSEIEGHLDELGVFISELTTEEVEGVTTTVEVINLDVGRGGRYLQRLHKIADTLLTRHWSPVWPVAGQVADRGGRACFSASLTKRSLPTQDKTN